MPVAHDVSTSSVRTATTDPYTFTHTPSGTPRGIVVSIVQPTATDNVSGVSYGGIALTRVVVATDTVTEPGRAELWFLGSAIPTGAQQVAIDFASATGDDQLIACTSLTADADTEVVDSDLVQQDASNPAVTLAYGGQTCMAIGAAYSGGTSPTSLAPRTGMTDLASRDFGVQAGKVSRQTTAGTSDFTFGYTIGTDDMALVALAVSESAALNRSGTVTGTGGGTVSLTQTSARAAIAGLTGGGSLATSPQKSAQAAPALAGGGGTVVVVETGRMLAVGLAGGGVVTPEWATERQSNIGVAGGGGLALSQTTSRPGAVVLVGGGAIGSSAESSRTVAIALTGGGAVSEAAGTERFASPAMSGGGTLLVQGGAEINEDRAGTATLSGGGGLLVEHSTGRAGLAALTGGGALSVTGLELVAIAYPLQLTATGRQPAATVDIVSRQPAATVDIVSRGRPTVEIRRQTP